MNFVVPNTPSSSSLIKVIGVGGGGSNAVAHMYTGGIVGVDFIICNTDKQNLDASPVPAKIQFGEKGLGAGAKPEVGKEAAVQSIDELKSYLDGDTQMVFITAGMGGGTGTGGAPVVAKECRERGLLTVAIVTTPFGWEGNRRKKAAIDGINELREYVDTIIIVSNDKVSKIYNNLSMSEAFAKADDILATGARGIAEIITKNGMINVDFQDVHTVMSNSGIAIMGTGNGSGEKRHIKAVKEALESPLLNDSDITGATDILLNICTGNDNISMDELSEISSYVQQAAGGEADLIWGSCVDPELDPDQVKIVLIATGFESKREQLWDVDPQPKRVSLDELDNDSTETPTTEPRQRPFFSADTPSEPPTVSPQPIEANASDQKREADRLLDTINRYRNRQAEEVKPPVVEENPRVTVVDFDSEETLGDALERHREERRSNKTTGGGGSESPNELRIQRTIMPTGTPTNSDSRQSRFSQHEQEMKQELLGRKHQLKDLSFKTNPHNSASLTEMKRSAAYKRQNVLLERARLSDQHDGSSRSVSGDEQRNFLGRNRFLHQSTD